jgi:hypothetical protein
MKDNFIRVINNMINDRPFASIGQLLQRSAESRCSHLQACLMLIDTLSSHPATQIRDRLNSMRKAIVHDTNIFQGCEGIEILFQAEIHDAD